MVRPDSDSPPPAAPHLARMVNELRAPLTALLGYLEALQDDVLVAGPPVYARMLTEARRLKLLIEALEERLRG